MSEVGNPAPPPTSPARPRFGWPMRVFLFIVVFNMIFRSLSVLFPWGDWLDDLDMRSLPIRMPTREEIAELSEQATRENPHPVRKEFMIALESTGEFFLPWPGEKTRDKVQSAEGWGKFAFCWISSRFDFVETILGINQEWPMFSPNVSKKKWLTRSRLIFEDGSQQIVRQTADPEDLTRYSHWFQEKILDYELQIREGSGRVSDCSGYCNLLWHRYPRNPRGSPLTRIELFQVLYHFCPPDREPVAWYQAQNGPPTNQVAAPFFEYEVGTRKGRMIPQP